MKILVTLLAMLVLSLCQEYYEPLYDNIDLEGILSDDLKLQAFMDCFIDRGTCDAVGAHFKNDLPEVTKQACAKCTPKQKHILKRFLEESHKRIPQDYKELKLKYDPQNKYYAELKKALENA